jgi:energy-coupling factor transporter ATP-binding protein EcfA2
MMAPEDFAQSVAVRASASLTKRKTRRESFSIGRLSFELVAPAETADGWLGRAFLQASQALSETGSGACQTLVAWDGTNREDLPPPPPWPATAPEPLGFVESYSNEAVRCAVDIHTGSLIVDNIADNTSYTWFPSICELPAWAKASPFRIILSWLCNRHRMQIVHGGAVSMEGRAVLLVGPGGSGKSTTALACALAGMEYLGDDYCAVEPKAGKVHMVYRTAKLFKSSIEMLPTLEAMIENRGKPPAEKGVIFLRPDDMRLGRSAELSAIVLPRVGAGPSTRLSTASRADVIKAILPSTIGGLMGGTSVTPRLILELASSIPAFHLHLGTNLNNVVKKIESLLAAPRCLTSSSP